MKIKFLVLAAILSAAIFGFSVKAQPVDNSALIAQLQAQIASLIAQIKVLQGNQGVSLGTWCHDFSINLKIGDSDNKNNVGNDIRNLQDILGKEGLYVSDYSAATDGTFTEGTAASVVRFQQKYGISATGFVGPLTRAKLNKLYGCGIIKALPSITIISPNGSESYQVNGGPINVKWTTNNVPSTFIFDVIRLRGYPNGGEYILATNVLNDGQETVAIPSSVPVGSYKLEMKAYLNNTLVMDASDNHFNIISSSQPSITVSSPNGEETWQKGTKQTIRWNPSYSCSSGMPCAVPSNVTVTLLGNFSGCSNSAVACLPVMDPIFTIASNVNDTGSYEWNVGNFSSAQYATAISSGKYSMRICESYVGGDKCDISDANFTIIDSTAACTPNWTCGWGQCINGYQSQTVIDANNCGASPLNSGIACTTLAQQCPATLSVVSGVCGTAAKYYSSNQELSGTFCTAGAPIPTTPAFEAGNYTVNWICQGSNGGGNDSCFARRLTSMSTSTTVY
jgi:peptidoglycan hydrolase-like protein with peptidoglycan-binding domain